MDKKKIVIGFFLGAALIFSGFFISINKNQFSSVKNIGKVVRTSKHLSMETSQKKEIAKEDNNVLGVEKKMREINISISNDKGGYGSGGIISQTTNEDPIVNASIFDYKSDTAKIEIYKADKEDLINYLLHNKDGNQLNADVDTKDMYLASSFDQDMNGGSIRITIPDASSGIWLIRVAADETDRKAFVVRSSFGATVKNGNDEMIFWAQDFNNKKKLSGVQIEVASFLDKKSVVDSAVTNDEGIAKTKIAEEADVAFLEKDGELAIIPINMRYVNYYPYAVFAPKTINHYYFVFTDRPIYQPGDKINFKAIIRNEDDARYNIPKGEVQVDVSNGDYLGDDNAEKVFSQKYFISDDGTISGDFVLPNDAKTGMYYLGVKIVNKEAGEEEFSWYSDSTSFNVEYYQKPEYEVSLDSNTDEIISGDELTFKIAGNYFSGQPLANKSVSYKIYSSDFYYYDYYSDYEDYKNIDNYRYRNWYGGNSISEGEATLDENGLAEIKIGGELTSQGGEKFGERIFTIETEFSDESGIPVFDSKNILVNAGEYSILRNDSNYYYGYSVGDQISLGLILVPHNQSKVSSIELKGNIKRTTWKEVIVPGKKYPKYVEENEDLEPITVKTDAQGKASIQFKATKEGSYDIEVVGTDDKGNIIKKNFYAWVSDERGFYWSGGNENSGLKIQSDKSQYDPGETAKLTISSNIPDRDVLLSIDRGRVNRYQVVRLKGNSVKIDMPLVDTDVPNIFADVSSFSDENLDADSVKLKVSAEGKRINVSFTLDKNKYNPGEEAIVTVKTSTMSGKPVSAETAVWVVDKAIFELADNKATGIFKRFWFERYDGTNKNHSLMGVISEGAEKGGGGGDGGGRSIFKDTAYWNPSVKTNANGTAQLTFKLPDNLTTWVVAGISATKDTRVGEGQNEILVSKDVIVRPVLPNILRVDDSITLSALVHNFTDKKLDFTANLKMDGAKVDSPEQEIGIEANAEKQVFWKVNPQVENEAAKITFSAISADKNLSDIVTKEIPIKKFGFWENTVDVGDDENKIYNLKLSKDIDIEKTTVNFSIAPTLIGTLPEAMKYLVKYPYGCVEQTTSRFVPAVIAKKNADIFSSSIADKNIDDIINKGIERLVSLQGEDGGWGWYGSNSDPFITAYVVEYLVEAKNLGFVIDESMLDKTKNFLEKDFDDYDYGFKKRRDRLVAERDEKVAKVYALSILDSNSEKGKTKLDNFNNITSDILALTVMANIRNGYIDPKNNGLSELLAMAKSEGDSLFWPTGVKYYFGSDDASTALAVRAIVMADQNRDLAVRGIRFLTKHRKSNYWSNTFATANIIRAVVDYSKSNASLNPQYGYSVILDGKEIQKGIISKFSQLDEISIPVSKIQANGSVLTVKKVGDGEVYSTLVIEEFHTDKKASAVNAGLSIRREYENVTNPGQNLHVGDTARVVLTVSGLTGEREYAVIQDELPSGIVPINKNLKNQQFDDGKDYNFNYYHYNQETTKNGMILTTYYIKGGDNIYAYEAKVISEGSFSVPPARAELMYSPEVHGRSAAQVVIIDNGSFRQLSKAVQSMLSDKRDALKVLLIIFLLLIPIGVFGYFAFKKFKMKDGN